MKYPKPPVADLKEKLSPLQFEVTQNDATEPPFRNAFWDNHEAGIYVDVVTGEPLFSSLDKFESGTGWPSFTQPLEAGHVVSKRDVSHGMVRVDVRSNAGDSHLGHVFDDGPGPTGTRFCINSASLRFVPVDRLEAEGYGAYAAGFQGASGAHANAAATDNACAVPPPGERPGCEATLDSAVLGGGPRMRGWLERVKGVLQVEVGSAGGVPALRVTFDPKKVAYVDLLDRWSAITVDERSRASRAIFVASSEQREIADGWTRAHRGAATVRDGGESSFEPAEG